MGEEQGEGVSVVSRQTSAIACPQDSAGRPGDGGPDAPAPSWCKPDAGVGPSGCHPRVGVALRARRLIASLLLVVGVMQPALADKLLIPMDLTQTDHLKAYGVVYWALQRQVPCEWLLNYRGGSFMMDYGGVVALEAQVRGVRTQQISSAQAAQIYSTIERENMEVIRLDKAPRIAVYTPPNKQPWDDAVTLALAYAEIDYTTLWDAEVLAGQLKNYDWLHLHHEDFTGQYGRFYISYHSAPWYQQQKAEYERAARSLGFSKVSEYKKAVARAIKAYVMEGGFLFAMCSATDTIDIALAAQDIDITAAICDGDGTTPNYNERLDFSKTMAFYNFRLEENIWVYEFSDIDTYPERVANPRGPEADFFTLFNFSAKFSPVESMLTQDHVDHVKGFLGQTVGFHRRVIKPSVVIMGEAEGVDEVKYIHGNVGRGTFTFLGGHDPEDYQHVVGDPPTDLSFHRNSPGYRLILNNVLFPAARKKEQKT